MTESESVVLPLDDPPAKNASAKVASIRGFVNHIFYFVFIRKLPSPDELLAVSD